MGASDDEMAALLTYISQFVELKLNLITSEEPPTSELKRFRFMCEEGWKTLAGGQPDLKGILDAANIYKTKSVDDIAREDDSMCRVSMPVAKHWLRWSGNKADDA